MKQCLRAEAINNAVAQMNNCSAYYGGPWKPYTSFYKDLLVASRPSCRRSNRPGCTRFTPHQQLKLFHRFLSQYSSDGRMFKPIRIEASQNTPFCASSMVALLTTRASIYLAHPVTQVTRTPGFVRVESIVNRKTLCMRVQVVASSVGLSEPHYVPLSLL